MITIRPFNKTDRAALRQICCDVADRGEKIENFFPDREFAADLLTSYYLDYEPDSTFVADVDGAVVGYINGCLDNRRYGLAVMFLIIPKLIIKGLVRGVFFRREFLLIFKSMLKNWRRVFVWRKQSFHSHQGHLHIGVAKGFRTQSIGQKLVRALLDYARQNNIHELAASVHDGNTAACRFFEQLGFVARDQYPMMMAYGDSFKEYHSVSYVKSII
ncbi:MAG: GNAT family N-acetyltransferase [Candidatus Omnitrophica bacterium]|nr:GNAT family N-acetyltransferase [Candidatus Omnitrophota bacterium]